uniref:Uncharacterized protein n=1 Tax=Sphaerodactylus townsendi TaxID=933632 RepID=A0ACB8E9P9_9SAUR
MLFLDTNQEREEKTLPLDTSQRVGEEKGPGESTAHAMRGRQLLAGSPLPSCRGAYFPSLKPSEIVFKIIFWLGYFNSCVNPIIYPCSSKEFKRAFIRLLKCQCRRRRRPIWRVYGNHWRGVSINGGGQDSDGESRSRISTLNGSFILNSGSLERPSKRRTLSFKRWRMFSPFQKPTTQLKEKMNSLSNKIRGGSAKGGVTASYRTEVESVSIGIPSEFMESIDYPMYDELTDSESRGLSETDI